MKKKHINFDILNNSAIVLKPKQPFWDWDNEISPDEPMAMDDKKDIVDAFLVPDFETAQEMEEYLKENFDSYFCRIIGSMYEEEEVWPKKRNYQMFMEWFEVIYSPMVWIDEEELNDEDVEED